MALCSIAIAVGVVGVAALAKRFVLRRRYACRRGGVGHSFWLRALFARLDTTPGQEREIRAALEDLRDRAKDAKGGLADSREGLGRAIGGDTFDVGAFESASAHVDATAEKVKDALRGALERIHAVLDPKQRARLAEIVSEGRFGRRGGRWSGGGGPYRGAEL